jgi:L-fuconolactonase
MKLDSHQHFWKYDAIEYGWIDNSMQLLQRDFLPHDLEAILTENGFSGTIAVQARQSLAETRWLLELAEKNPFIKGVIGWVDLCAKDIELQLAELSKHTKLVGVRHVLHDEADDQFMLRAEFKNGIRCLKKYNLTYDLLLFPKHLKIASQLVAEFPDQPFVLDHISKPPIKAGTLEPWKSDIEELAKFKNVYCKLSGMVTEADLNNWNQSTFDTYLEIIVDTFGPDRLMIGSDWPVCLLGGDYSEVIAIVTKYISKFELRIQHKIMGENAIQFYHLSDF